MLLTCVLIVSQKSPTPELPLINLPFYLFCSFICFPVHHKPYVILLFNASLLISLLPALTYVPFLFVYIISTLLFLFLNVSTYSALSFVSLRPQSYIILPLYTSLRLQFLLSILLAVRISCTHTPSHKHTNTHLHSLRLTPYHITLARVS